MPANAYIQTPDDAADDSNPVFSAGVHVLAWDSQGAGSDRQPPPKLGETNCPRKVNSGH